MLKRIPWQAVAYHGIAFFVQKRPLPLLEREPEDREPPPEEVDLGLARRVTVLYRYSS